MGLGPDDPLESHPTRRACGEVIVDVVAVLHLWSQAWGTSRGEEAADRRCKGLIGWKGAKGRLGVGLIRFDA